MQSNKGLGLGEDAVILDIGSKFIRAGYGGEARPRVVYPNQIYDEHVQIDAHNLSQYEYCQSVKKSLLWDFDSFQVLSDQEAINALEKNLSTSLRIIFEQKLLLNPSSERRFIVCLAPVLATAIVRSIENVLNKCFRAKSVEFVDSSLLSCLAFGRISGLSVCVGNLETIIVPVYEGIPLVSLCRYALIGARSIALSLSQSALDNSTDLDTLVSQITFREPVVSDHLDTFCHGNEDAITIDRLILETISKCPMDIRRCMGENILLHGGCASIPGFAKFLLKTISKRASTGALSNIKFCIKDTSFVRANISWTGASIFSQMNTTNCNK